MDETRPLLIDRKHKHVHSLKRKLQAIFLCSSKDEEIEPLFPPQFIEELCSPGEAEGCTKSEDDSITTAKLKRLKQKMKRFGSWTYDRIINSTQISVYFSSYHKLNNM